MDRSPPTHAMSIDEFEAFLALPENSDRLFEMIDGEIVEKMPTERHGLIIFTLSGYLFIYLADHPIGRATVETRYRPADDTRNDRIPDLSFTRNERLTEVVEKGAVLRLPDLCVEVKSPTEKYIDFRSKAAYYLDNGAAQVWLIYPREKLVEVYTAGQDIAVLTVVDTLDGGDLLPGFTLAIKTLFGL